MPWVALSEKFPFLGDSWSNEAFTGDNALEDEKDGRATPSQRSNFLGETFILSLNGDCGSRRAGLPSTLTCLEGDEGAVLLLRLSFNGLLVVVLRGLVKVFAGDFAGVLMVLSPDNSSSELDGVFATWLTFLGDSGNVSVFADPCPAEASSRAFFPRVVARDAAGFRIGFALIPVGLRADFLGPDTSMGTFSLSFSSWTCAFFFEVLDLVDVVAVDDLAIDTAPRPRVAFFKGACSDSVSSCTTSSAGGSSGSAVAALLVLPRGFVAFGSSLSAVAFGCRPVGFGTSTGAFGDSSFFAIFFCLALVDAAFG